MKRKMRKVSITFNKEDSEIAYLIDSEARTYSILTRQLEDGNVKEEVVTESGALGDAQNQQEIAKRIYYTLLASMKNG